MLPTANITIYLQALGAHYLGAHACNPADIEIAFKFSGGTINVPYPVVPNFSSDGNTSPNFVSGASSFMPIITVPQAATAPQVAAVNFLSPDLTTVCGKLSFLLPEQLEFAELTVKIPTSINQPMQLQQQVLLNPAQPDYQLTVVVPGLYLIPYEMQGYVAVYVKMMCGCPVTEGPPASLWPANDFIVYANVLDIQGNTTSYSLSYHTGQTGNSLFTAPLQANQAPVKLITFTAIQRSTGNYGAVVQQAG